MRRLPPVTMLGLAAVALCATSVAASTPRGSARTGYPTPGFTTFAAPANLSDPLSVLDNKASAGEPSIGINWKSDAILYQANTSTFKIILGKDDEGQLQATWSAVTPPNSVFNADPILFTDSSTGRTFAGGLAGSCSVLAYTDDDGASWIPLANPCSGTYDHETIGAGPWAGAQPLTATYPRAVYYCAQGFGLNTCASSSTGGLTFGPPVPSVALAFPNGTTPYPRSCIGAHGHVKVSADGTAYVPSHNCLTDVGEGSIGGNLSRDNGQTWQPYFIPKTPSIGGPPGFDPSVATTPDNTVYESWSRSGDLHPMVAWSKDHGSRWTTLDLTSTGSPARVSTFHAMVAGDNGRVAVAYLGSTTPGNAFAADWHGVWHLYVSTTYDAGKTWTTTKVSRDPVQRGYICYGGSCLSGRNLLDFMDASLTADGHIVVGYADGCTQGNGCASASGTEAQSTAKYATIAVQTSGKALSTKRRS